MAAAMGSVRLFGLRVAPSIAESSTCSSGV